MRWSGVIAYYKVSEKLNPLSDAAGNPCPDRARFPGLSLDATRTRAMVPSCMNEMGRAGPEPGMQLDLQVELGKVKLHPLALLQ